MLSSGDKQTHSLHYLFCTKVFSFIDENSLFIPKLGKPWKVLCLERQERKIYRKLTFLIIVLSSLQRVIRIPRVLEGAVMQDDHNHDYTGF